jgi:hypothetical protein
VHRGLLGGDEHDQEGAGVVVSLGVL